MIDRGMIKWEPFNSVAPSSKMLNEVMKEKNKIKKPILSDDQLKDIETKLLDGFNELLTLEIDYYENGYIKKINGQIKKIDYTKRCIYLLNKVLYINQIINII